LSRDGCRKIIAVHQQGKREIMDAYGVPEEKVVVVHNGVDLDRFHPRRRLAEGRKIREALNIAPERQVALFVGNGFRRKGLDRLLRLWRSGDLNGVDLLVVGGDSMLAYYRGRYSGNGIFFAGPQPRVEDYYAAADLLVLPSSQEAFGNVVLEALASGLPVVTIRGVGAIDEIEGDLLEGVLRDPDDLEELKRKILRLLERDRWPALSRAAREVAKKYSWDGYLLEIERQLLELAGSRG
jgi:UDP-glucose:(heptosyl)LPS alpha-1,3-glucosyltransferase